VKAYAIAVINAILFIPSRPILRAINCSAVLAIACLILLLPTASIGRQETPHPTPPSAQESPAPPARPAQLFWAVTGAHTKNVSLQGTSIRPDAVIFYQHEFGLYPRFHDGKPLNGGVPQAADLPGHLARLRLTVEKAIPDPNFSGCAIIDFEGWDPIWEVTGEEYRQLSRDLVRKRYPNRSPNDIERLAKAGFEAAAQKFLLETLKASRAVRPKALWGYYALPWDFHAPYAHRLSWLWQASSALYPNAYTVHKGIELGTRPGPGEGFIKTYKAGVDSRVALARHLGGKDKPVYAMVWVRYHDLNQTYGGKMLERPDLEAMLTHPLKAGANGLVFWDDIGTPEMAAAYSHYMRSDLIPAITRTGIATPKQ